MPIDISNPSTFTAKPTPLYPEHPGEVSQANRVAFEANGTHDARLKPPTTFPIDDNVLAKFAEGTTIVSAVAFGTSVWTVTAHLHIEYPDGENGHFFLKIAEGDHGQVMMEGEFNAMSALYDAAPHMVPKPHSFGQQTGSNPSKYFFLSEFIPLSDQLPEPTQLCAKLAKLHIESESPNGKFGFPISTCQGRIPQSVGWEENWTVFFSRLLQHVIDLDFETNGDWDDMKKLGARLISHVVPRLLDPLTSNGRVLKPSLIHGDLWEGNTGTSLDNGNIYIFDAASFYAHNEMETGNWRCYYNKIANKVYTRTYLRHNPPSEPTKDWEDRNRLYSIYYNVIYSVNHMGQGTAVRQLAYYDMYHLIDKFSPFDDDTGPPRLDKSEMATLSAERDHTVD